MESNEIEIHSLNDFLSKVLTFQQENDEHFYFRGESKKHSTAIPNLYLNKSLSINGSEYYYRTLFSELGQHDYISSSFLIEHFSELQHYSAKTRFLDVSKNPLVALYFACEKYDCKEEKYKDPSEGIKDGCVYVYKIKTCEEKFDTGHTIAIKAALNLMPQEVINDFIAVCSQIKSEIEKDSKLNWDYIKTIPLDILRNAFKDEDGKEKVFAWGYVYTFMDLLNQRAKVNEQLKYPLEIYDDISKAHLMIPTKVTERIKAQQGFFICPMHPEITEDNYENAKELINASVEKLGYEFYDVDTNKTYEKLEFKICGKYKKEIKKQLAMIGITNSFVYPGIGSKSDDLIAELYK